MTSIQKRFMNQLVWLSWLCLIGIALFGCRGDNQTLDRIQADGVIRVGLDPTFPPFENGDGGLHGIDVDLAEAIGRELGVRVEFVLFGYDGLYDALQIGRCDILLSALIVDVTKTKDFTYSEPYFNAGQFLVLREDQNETTELADFEGKTLSVETGSAGHVTAISAQNRVRDLGIKTFPTPDDAMWTVLQGETDGAIIDQVNAKLYAQTHSGLVLAPNPVTVEPYAIVTRKDDGALQRELDRILVGLEQSGELNSIVSRWLD